MEVANDAQGLATPLVSGDLVRVSPIIPAYQKTVTIRGNIANPGRFAWHSGMRVSELIPDKDSLITRNYWWKRAQEGLPAPEFEPVTELSDLRQPQEPVNMANPAALRELQQQSLYPSQQNALQRPAECQHRLATESICGAAEPLFIFLAAKSVPAATESLLEPQESFNPNYEYPNRVRIP